MKYLIIIFSLLILASCIKEKAVGEIDEKTLASYISQNADLNQTFLIACAAGKQDGLDGTGTYPTSIFFYPEEGAVDYRYFEAENLADSLNFDKYVQIDLIDLPVFNGYLRKFDHLPFAGERMAIVTSLRNGNLHISDPIRLKTNVKPTEVNPSLTVVSENGVTPKFDWTNGVIDENVIFFQVISDTIGNLISGTYTYDSTFTFYDLNNVVLNVSPINPAPSLDPNSTYNFTLMGVSEDNWVNALSEQTFQTQ